MIYKNFELKCTEQELKTFKDSLKLESEIKSFSEKYNNVVIENPTGVENAKYYVLTVAGNVTLQTNVPYIQGFVPLTDENIKQVIEQQKEEMLDDIIISKFRVTEEDKQVRSEERLAALEKSNAEMMGMIATMTTPTT